MLRFICHLRPIPWACSATVWTVTVVSGAKILAGYVMGSGSGLGGWCWCASDPVRQRVSSSSPWRTRPALRTHHARRFEQFRRIVLSAKVLGITGLVQREGRVIHVVVEKLEDLTYRLGWLTDGSVDEAGFNGAIANADEVCRPQDDYREKLPRPKLPLHPPPNPEQFRPSKPLHTHPRNMKPDLKVVSRDFH